MADITANFINSSEPRPQAQGNPLTDPTSPAPYMLALALGVIILIGMDGVKEFRYR